MKCKYCEKEFSDKIINMHMERCRKPVKQIMKDAVNEVKKELKKEGKTKSKKVK